MSNSKGSFFQCVESKSEHFVAGRRYCLSMNLLYGELGYSFFVPGDAPTTETVNAALGNKSWGATFKEVANSNENQPTGN